ncbi:MAG: response regulator [Pseudomonadota bacterium]|nr:response regulator [Pseudomonadota bacterium]
MNKLGRVLVVEDDPDDAFFVEKAFGVCCPGVELAFARDGDQAVDYLEAECKLAAPEPLRLHVLLDLKLPRRSGLEVLRWIRSHPKLGAIPVTIMSGSELSNDVAEANALGVSDYIRKPVTYAAFLERIRLFCASGGLLPAP